MSAARVTMAGGCSGASRGDPAAPAAAPPGSLPVRPRRTARDWTAAGATLDRAAADPATYGERGRGLRDLVFALALDDPPEDFFAARLSGPLPEEEIDVVGGQVSAAKYARWILFWGMALAGSGHVPPALLAGPGPARPIAPRNTSRRRRRRCGRSRSPASATGRRSMR